MQHSATRHCLYLSLCYNLHFIYSRAPCLVNPIITIEIPCYRVSHRSQVHIFIHIRLFQILLGITLAYFIFINPSDFAIFYRNVANSSRIVIFYHNFTNLPVIAIFYHNLMISYCDKFICISFCHIMLSYILLYIYTRFSLAIGLSHTYTVITYLVYYDMLV